MAFQTKRFLRDKIMHLEYRVKELEERLCPCEDHDWKRIGSHDVWLGPMDTETVFHFKCRRCGKYAEGDEI